MRTAYVFRMLSIHWQRKKRRIYDSARAEYINKMPLCPFYFIISSYQQLVFHALASLQHKHIPQFDGNSY